MSEPDIKILFSYRLSKSLLVQIWDGAQHHATRVAIHVFEEGAGLNN